MSARPGAPRVLHIHGSLAEGDPAAQRSVRLINAFGGRLAHRIVAADGPAGDSGADALARLDRGIRVERVADFPRLDGIAGPGRLERMARAMAGHDLVLTYGRGGVVAALAHTMFSQLHSLPPLIHHEDGADETPRERRGLRSTWLRRIGLGKAAGLVVPGEVMEEAALVHWQQPMGRVKLIRDGVDLKSLTRKPKADAIPRLLKRPDENWLACIAPSAARVDIAGMRAIVAALGETGEAWQLVIHGDPSVRAALESEISRLRLDNRVHYLRAPVDPAVLIALADVLVVPGGPDPLPREALLAMGAGKPVAGFETGDLAHALAPDNADAIVARGDAAALSAAIVRLTGDDWLRKRIGQTNRDRAAEQRDAAAMIAAYRRLYASAMRIDTI